MRPEALGRGTLNIPREAVDREYCYVQLLSCRTESRVGPAVSRIIRLPAPGRNTSELPELSFAREAVMQTASMHQTHSGTVPMRYQEMPYSRSMFFGALASILPSVLPAVAPLLGNLIGGLTGGGGSGGGGSSGSGGGVSDLLRQLASPDVIRQITQLIGQISGGSSTAAAPAASQSLAAPSIRRRHYYSHAHNQIQSGYSEAQNAQLITMLLPLLRQVMTPETVQSAINQPNQHMNTVINGLKDFARIGAQVHEQERQHLRALNPGVDDPALDNLLASMSLALSQPQSQIAFTRARSVHLRFVDTVPQTLFGKSKVLYQVGGALAFPVSVETPRTVTRGILELAIKDPDSLEILHYQKTRVQNVSAGPLSITPRLDQADASTLAPGKDYLVCVALIWKNRAGDKRGTSMQQRISLVGPYVFDRVEESSELIPLNDVTRFRSYWHKIWQGSFTDEVKRFVFQCKYYTVLRSEEGSNARTETKMKIQTREDGRVEGKLKAGLEISPDELNRLLPQLVPGQSPLNEDVLQALRSRDFSERFNQAARYQARLRGRPGDHGVLWVYPEVKLQTIVLQKVTQTDAQGQVRGLGEERVTFPLPVVMHFIGARSE